MPWWGQVTAPLEGPVAMEGAAQEVTGGVCRLRPEREYPARQGWGQLHQVTQCVDTGISPPFDGDRSDGD